MNHITLQGRLGKDPDVRYTQGQSSTAVARFNLAVRNRFRKKEGDQDPRPDWIPCVAFGKNGEFAEKYLKQGKPVIVEGRLESGSYKNRDGATVYTLEVIVESFDFPEQDQARNSQATPAAPASENTKSHEATPAPAPKKAEEKPAPAPVEEEFVSSSEDEELPWN